MTTLATLFQQQHITAAQGNISISVASGGSDTPTADRPERLVKAGTYADAFATIEAAMAALPRDTAGYDITISAGAGTFAALVAAARGFFGAGTVKISGALTAATLASGPSSGTAGAGSSTTALKNAAANWTASDLVGRIVHLTIGGETVRRVILSNTTDTAVVRAATGLTSGVVYAIFDRATFVDKDATTGDCLVIEDSTCSIVIEDLAFAGSGVDEGVRFERCSNALARGLVLDVDAVKTLRAIDCYAATVEDCALSAGADIELRDCKVPTAQRLYADDGAVLIVGGRATVELDASACIANALKLVSCDYADIDLVANDCTATPLVCEGVRSGVLTQATGANSGTARFAEFSKGCNLVVTGADGAGSNANEMLLEGAGLSWSKLASFGSASAVGTSVHWGGDEHLFLRRVRIPAEASGTSDGITNEIDTNLGATTKMGGFLIHDGNAGGTAIAAAGSTQGDATLCRYQTSIVTSGSGGVRLQAAAFPVTVCAVVNRSGGAINLYPPSGHTLNDEVSADLPLSLPDDSLAICYFIGSGLWVVFVVSLL